MFHITVASKMSHSVDVISPHCVSEHNKAEDIQRYRPTKTKCNGKIKNRELPPADNTVQALFEPFLLTRDKESWDAWWAGCTAIFRRSVTYWWKVSLAPLLHPLAPWLWAEWAGVLPLGASYRAEPPTRRNWTRALSLVRCDFSPHHHHQPPPVWWHWLQGQLWQHLILFSPFGQVGFSHRVG